MSWLRNSDTSLLTVGRYTYTTDLRFEAFHSPHTEDWIIQLRNPKPSDTGIYECQISTTPHLTHKIYLKVHGKQLFTLFYDFRYNLVIYFSQIRHAYLLFFEKHDEKPLNTVNVFMCSFGVWFRKPLLLILFNIVNFLLSAFHPILRRGNLLLCPKWE